MVVVPATMNVCGFTRSLPEEGPRKRGARTEGTQGRVLRFIAAPLSLYWAFWRNLPVPR